MIEIKSLLKKFDKTTILEGIDLEIAKNSVFCLLGKNGAGKTTLISILLDLIEPDSGEIFIEGKHHDNLNAEDKRKWGVAIENLALIEEISGYDYLKFMGKIYEMETLQLQERITDLFSYFFENDADLKKNIATYSTGMKKKIAFCAAVLHAPKILVLDEPFSGLDPLVANQMVLFLQKYQREDRLIFVSSHDLTYVQKIATHIGVLDEGKMVFNGTLQQFTAEGAQALDAALLRIIQPNTNELDKMNWV